MDRNEFDYTVEHRVGRLHSNADAMSRHICKQCWLKNSPASWIDELERADELVGPLGIRTLQMLPEFSAEDLAEKQAEDTEIREAYQVLAEGKDPSPDELRAMMIKSRFLLSQRPEITLC